MVCDIWLFREMIKNQIRDVDVSGKQSRQRTYHDSEGIRCIVKLLPKPYRMVAVGDENVSAFGRGKMAAVSWIVGECALKRKHTKISEWTDAFCDLQPNRLFAFLCLQFEVPQSTALKSLRQ